MADVKKINGYNIKDASARSNISTLDSQINTPSTGIDARVTALETTIDTPATGLSDRVSAIESDINSPSTGLDARLTQAESDIDNLEIAESFSTSEIAVGTWINGDIIYRKVIEINELPEVASQSYAETTYYTGIFNADYVTSIGGCFWGTNINGKVFVPVNYPLMGLKSGIFSVGTIMASQSLEGHEGELIVHLYSTDTSNFYEKGYVILEYTKITEVVGE